MSYIDSYAHEFVGYFAGRPVYHPLEDIPGDPEDPADFACTKSQLVVGGGGGELPGMVLKDPVSAVARYISQSDDFDLDDDQEFDLIDAARSNHMLEFAGWDSRQHHEFYVACASEAMPHPFREGGDISFEDWIGESFGEFIFFAMPELAAELVATYTPLLSKPPHPVYSNILLMPPGMQSFANGGTAFASERTKKK